MVCALIALLLAVAFPSVAWHRIEGRLCICLLCLLQCLEEGIDRHSQRFRPPTRKMAWQL
jgi:hypothetical protein